MAWLFTENEEVRGEEEEVAVEAEDVEVEGGVEGKAREDFEDVEEVAFLRVAHQEVMLGVGEAQEVDGEGEVVGESLYLTVRGYRSNRKGRGYAPEMCKLYANNLQELRR